MDISKTKSYITAENAPIGIEIKTSTRYGGFSSAPYNSLNMGYFTEYKHKLAYHHIF